LLLGLLRELSGECLLWKWSNWEIILKSLKKTIAGNDYFLI